jgi:hypothetical protein
MSTLMQDDHETRRARERELSEECISLGALLLVAAGIVAIVLVAKVIG